MQKTLVCFVVLISILSGGIISYANAQKLSKEQVRKILLKEKAYPQKISVVIRQSDQADALEAKLRSDQCIDTSNREWVIDGIQALFKSSPKCKSFFDSIEYVYYANGTKSTNIKVMVLEENINEITEILTDSKQGIAEIKYTTILKPYGPYYEFVCSLKNSWCEAPNTINSHNVTLRKYDEGWKVMR